MSMDNTDQKCSGKFCFPSIICACYLWQGQEVSLKVKGGYSSCKTKTAFLAGSSSLPSLLTEISLPWCPEATLVLQPPPVRQEWLQMSTSGSGEGAHSVICLSPAMSFLPLFRPVTVLLACFFYVPLSCCICIGSKSFQAGPLAV